MRASRLEEDKLFERIESKASDLIELTRDLIRIPTVNPPGENYRDCAELLGSRLASRGFEVDYIRAENTPGDSDRYPRINLVACREGKRPGPCVHFNGHLDVVDVGLGWRFDPFAAEMVDGRIYGRGACDMKGGLAAAIIAIESLLEVSPDFPGRIELSGTADEETGGYGGVAFLAQKGILAQPRVDHVIIPEPLNKERVCLGHRGVWWAEIETFGHMAHGSMPFQGDCAVRHMAAVLEAFEQSLFPMLQQKTTRMPVVPDGARQSTLNINAIHGGLSESFEGLPSPLVPDSCRLVIDRRFLIEENLPAVKAEVKNLLDDLVGTRSNFRYQIKDIFEVIPSMTDENAPVAQAVAASIQRVLQQPAEFVVSPGTYDQKHFNRIGQLHDCVAYGPGILDLAHQPDEYIEVQDMLDSAKIMALALNHLLWREKP